jgi:hypothetical protein
VLVPPGSHEVRLKIDWRQSRSVAVNVSERTSEDLVCSPQNRARGACARDGLRVDTHAIGRAHRDEVASAIGVCVENDAPSQLAGQVIREPAELGAWRRHAPIVARGDQTVSPGAWIHDRGGHSLTPTTRGQAIGHVAVASAQIYELRLGGSFARGCDVSVADVFLDFMQPPSQPDGLLPRVGDVALVVLDGTTKGVLMGTCGGLAPGVVATHSKVFPCS